MTHEELVEAVALFCAGSTAGGQRMRAEKVLAIAAAALKEPTEEMVRAAFVAPEYAVAPEGDGRLAAIFAPRSPPLRSSRRRTKPMPEIDEITRAVRSVLGEMMSPETAHRLAKALRPIHGREAAEEIARYGRIAANEASQSDVAPMGSLVGLAHQRAAEHLSSFIRRAFGDSND